MRIRADALKREGYRLPTEAECEYACRAGAGTSRNYGLSTELLQKYAWYQANSEDRAWPSGSLMPNDLGLFDMLGNVHEWAQGGYAERWQKKKGFYSDEIYISESINDTPRFVGGGGVVVGWGSVRSARVARDGPCS